MIFFKKRNRKKIVLSIVKKQTLWRTLLFVVGAFLSALSFNLFYVPNNFVTGGLSGFSIILNFLFEINETLVILIGNLFFIILSIIFLGFKKSLLSITGALTYTAFVYVTEDIPNLIAFSFDNILLYVLAAGLVGGFGEALVYKAGFTTGGTSIPAQIMQEKMKIPIGQAIRYISIVIILLGGIIFGYTAIMYSLIILYLSTVLVDRIMLGISTSKTFFVQTEKEEEVKDFILNIIESGVTEIDTKGAFTNKKKKMIMCVVPTEKYSFLKSAIKEIDPHSFIVVSDCYEVYGGTKREKMSFGIKE